jgi:hypothetical protein
MLATRQRLHCADPPPPERDPPTPHTSHPHSLSSPRAHERVGAPKTSQNNQKSKTPLSICGELSLEESAEGAWVSRSEELTGPSDKGREGQERDTDILKRGADRGSRTSESWKEGGHALGGGDFDHLCSSSIQGLMSGLIAPDRVHTHTHTHTHTHAPAATERGQEAGRGRASGLGVLQGGGGGSVQDASAENADGAAGRGKGGGSRSWGKRGGVAEGVMEEKGFCTLVDRRERAEHVQRVQTRDMTPTRSILWRAPGPPIESRPPPPGQDDDECFW